MNRDQVDINTLDLDINVEPTPEQNSQTLLKKQEISKTADNKPPEEEEDYSLHATQALRRSNIPDIDDEFNYVDPQIISTTPICDQVFKEFVSNSAKIIHEPHSISKVNNTVNCVNEVIMEEEENNPSEEDENDADAQQSEMPVEKIDKANLLTILGKEIQELKKNDQRAIEERNKQERRAREDMISARIKESKLQNNSTVIKNNLKRKNEQIQRLKSQEIKEPSKGESIPSNLSLNSLNENVPLPYDSQIESKYKPIEKHIDTQIPTNEVSKDEDTNKMPSQEALLPAQLNDKEWDKINENFIQDSTLNIKRGLNLFEPITYDQAHALLCKTSLEKEKKEIVPTNERNLNLFQKLFARCRGIYVLPAHLREERDNYMALTKVHLDLTQDLHSRIIRSAYFNFTGSNSCSWQKIGFQSNNPTTDDRGMGILGILQLLYFTEFKDHAMECYEYSNKGEYSFPLAITLISFSSLAITAMREGRLTKQCKQKHSVVDVINLFYRGSFNYFFRRYRENLWKIENYGEQIKNINKYCKTNVNKIIKNIS